MAPVPRVRYQVGIALDYDRDRLAVLADADALVLAQAQQIVIARLLRDSPWRADVVIVRVADGVGVDHRPDANPRAT